MMYLVYDYPCTYREALYKDALDTLSELVEHIVTTYKDHERVAALKIIEVKD